MKRKHIIVIFVIAVVFVVVFCVIQFQNTTHISLEFYGAEVMNDGTIMDDGKLSFSGKLYEEKDRIRFKEMTLSGSEVILPETDGFKVYRNLSDEYILIHGQLRFPQDQYIERFDLYLSTDSDWCVIWMDEANRLFVGSIHEDFIASEILEKVSRHLK